jgi:hypothetical protein
MTYFLCISIFGNTYNLSSCLTRVRNQELISIRKYQEISGNAYKFQEILGYIRNTKKYQEIQDQKYEILWYFYATLVRLEFIY